MSAHRWTPPETLPCPICRGPSGVRAVRSSRVYHQCSTCRTAWLHPQPTESELAEYYSHFHRPAGMGGTYHLHESRAGADFDAKLRLLGRFAPRGARLLDAGCGRGFFIAAANRAGFEGHGIDLSDTATAYARTALGLEVRCGRLEDQHDWREAFDAAAMLPTIEHLPDPQATLVKLYEALTPGGTLLLDTGLAGDFCDRHAPGTTQWYDSPQHLWVFSAAGLEMLLDRAGFEVVHRDLCFDRSPFRRLARRVRNAAASALGKCLWRCLLGRAGLHAVRQDAKLPYGNLMLLVARKPPDASTAERQAA